MFMIGWMYHETTDLHLLSLVLHTQTPFVDVAQALPYIRYSKQQRGWNVSRVLSVRSATMPLKQLNFITGNKGKLTETKAILGDTVDLQSQSLDLVEIQGTIEEISIDKCRRAAEIASWCRSYFPRRVN
jgi:hypothetical protein